jgi:RNA polymerase sigma-70 factor (ECF subfamily)
MKESHQKANDLKTFDELDKDILSRAKEGDPKAFEKIVRTYEEAVYNFSFKVCRDQEYAEETLQDTFVNVFRKLKQFDGKSKFSTWLYSIVANNCLMKHRRRKLEASSVSIDEPRMPDHATLGESLPSWRNTPLEDAMDSELRARLDAAIQKLPVDYRLTFLLRDVEGKSASETAKILKITVAAVKSRLRRARVFLRNELNDYMTK